VSHDDERRRSRLIGAVTHLLAPSAGPVHGVEQPATHDHGTTCRGRAFEDLVVDRVLLHHPRVQLGSVAEPVLFISTRPGDESVERHRDIGNHLRHRGLLSATVKSADRRTARNSSRPGNRFAEVIYVSAV